MGSATISQHALNQASVFNAVEFGAVGDGSTDDTAELQVAIDALNTAGGGTLIIGRGTFVISDTLSPHSNIAIRGIGMGATIIRCADGDISQFYGESLTNVVISDLTISVTVAGTTDYVGGIYLKTCTHCRIERVEITGVSHEGIFLEDTDYSTVRNCYLHDWRGALNETADIFVLNNSSYNTIADNRCNGGGFHGIEILGQASSGARNLVNGNRVGQHKAYGIIDYHASDANSYNQTIDNYIEDIQGTTHSGNSGAGIYLVGSGGALVKGNTVRHCCVQTNSKSLVPAGIGINGALSTVQPTDVIGNTVTEMTNYIGIYVANGASGVNLVGNTINMPVENTDGEGAIQVFNASNVNIVGNHITLPNTGSVGQRGIFFNASVSIENSAISNNLIFGGGHASIDLSGASGSRDILITGNQCRDGDTSNIPLRISDCQRLTVTGNYFSGSSNSGVVVQAGCTFVRYTGNFIRAGGTIGLAFTSTNTGSYFDKSNYFDGAVNNAGTGIIIETLGNAAPTTGTWAVGDRVEQSVPVVGNSKGWRCTVAGSPGTWTSEGNL